MQLRGAGNYQQHARAPALADSIGGKTVNWASGVVMGEARDHMFCIFGSQYRPPTSYSYLRSQPDDAPPPPPPDGGCSWSAVVQRNMKQPKRCCKNEQHVDHSEVTTQRDGKEENSVAHGPTSTRKVRGRRQSPSMQPLKVRLSTSDAAGTPQIAM